jgi:translation initiation factor 2A
MYKGPIHDVQWNPSGDSYVVISGFVPAGSVLYDKTGIPIYEFGKHHRNLARWSPNKRYLLLGGFGNLNGEIEIWDVSIFKKIGNCKVNY